MKKIFLFIVFCFSLLMVAHGDADDDFYAAYRRAFPSGLFTSFVPTNETPGFYFDQNGEARIGQFAGSTSELLTIAEDEEDNLFWFYDHEEDTYKEGYFLDQLLNKRDCSEIELREWLNDFNEIYAEATSADTDNDGKTHTQHLRQALTRNQSKAGGLRSRTRRQAKKKAPKRSKRTVTKKTKGKAPRKKASKGKVTKKPQGKATQNVPKKSSGRNKKSGVRGKNIRDKEVSGKKPTQKAQKKIVKKVAR